MAEEFHESDIIFADHHHRCRRRRFFHPSLDFAQILLTTHRNPTRNNTNDDNDSDSDNNDDENNNNNNKDFAASLPVKIPETVFRYSSDMEEMDEEWDSTEENNNIVPPHVIIGRRVAGKMAFSVRSGNGRTLKGRDLSEVRNSILRMTGFLET